MALTYLRPPGLHRSAPAARPVPRYRHHPGVHGASTALRNVYAHRTGEVLSEPLCFGLGAGLGFSLQRDPQRGVWRVGGRGAHLESQFCHLLGIRCKAYQAEDADLAWTHALRLVDQGRRGNFRPLYASFLDEAAELLGSPALRPAAQHYRGLGARWQEAAEALRRAGPGATFTHLDEIATLEEAGLGLLEGFLSAGR